MAEPEPTSDGDDELTPVEIERDESTLARRVVRPPRVWMGVGAALVGMIVIGVALVTPAQWIAFVGAVIVIAGGMFAWWNGVLADAHGGGMASTAEEELPEDAHVGTLPGDRLHDERAVSDAARAEAAVASVEGEPRLSPPLSRFERGRAAALVLAVCAAWLVLTLPTFALEPENHDPGLRQAAAAIVVALAAIRMVVTGPTIRWALAAAIASLLLLVSLAVWWPDFNGPRIAGVVGGMVSLGAAASVIVALKPRRTRS
ncbi:hypothetical protein [Aeromicrobium sp. CF3.5]|uniref:hypothetical protein n=1 Tax=Aeromicrobium sp. CF3.5 TaxID=3373078 RepID=UPI003EE4C81C